MTREAAIAANRFGLGARPGELKVISVDPQGWLLNQLSGSVTLSSEIASLKDSASILVDVARAREMQNEQKKQGKSKKDSPVSYGRTVRGFYRQQVAARYQSAVGTDFPFHERLVHFWSNHFAVSADKQPLPALAGSLENEVIRAHLSGNFYDMLLAVEKHPAMLLYLDNQRSVGPASAMGVRAARRNTKRKTGLNENLAREILELHTVGVNGGYTQAHVTDFARALTGWSIGNDRGRRPSGSPGKFHFREAIHQPGSVTVLSKTYSQTGVRQAEAILKDLAVHPETARHIATKLTRHFVADDPPAAMIDRLAKVFLDSDGDLKSLHKALVTSEDAWKHTHAKYKTPDDFLVSTLRALNHTPRKPQQVFSALEMMGQTPYQPGSPAGWPDTAAHWGGADSLYKRIEWANKLASVAGNRINPVELADDVLGVSLDSGSRKAIARAESVEQGLTLLLVSPDFQRR
jgi:uncharacterized protein (DUF1800 family)